MKKPRKSATGNPATRERPKFPVISEQMQHWSAMLQAEVESWPAVSCKRMFGFRFLYRRKAVFAALPYTRGLLAPSSILLKFNPMPTGLFRQAQQEPRLDAAKRVSGKGWFSFELFSDADVRDAIWWLNQAYEGARKGAAK
ncbi:MAG TPA: hypothetical protein VGF61_16260 [Candidatus Acidoferrum sp.]|jgi:hypothetical protein